MFFLLGGAGTAALDFLTSKASLASSRTNRPAGGASGADGPSYPSASASSGQSPAAATGPSPGWTPLSPSVLGFLIQNQGASSTGGAAASQAGRLSAASDGSRDGFRSQFSQLAAALNAGKLVAAQTAYSALSQPGGQQSATGTPFGQALAQIGQNLKAGNLSGAQQTMASLQPQMPGAASGLHHHHHGGAGAGEDAPSGPNSATSMSANPTVAGASSAVLTNADGSTTTGITYPDSATATMTTPAKASATYASAAANSVDTQPAANKANVLATLIQMQTQTLTQSATTSG